MREFLGSTFRANPAYTLVQLDRLPEAERTLIQDSPDGGPDDELYGVLKPVRDHRLPVRAVSPDTALLLLTLATPGPLPGYVLAQLGRKAEAVIAALVLDGVLELELDSRYLSGTSAAEHLPDQDGPSTGRIGEVTAAALRYALSLDGLAEADLAGRLYHYGREPVHPALRHRFPDGSAVAAYLGLVAGHATHTRLASAGWAESPHRPGEHRHWRQWRPARQGMSTYKLYVSPTRNALPAVLADVVDVMSSTPGPTALKVGADLADVCRPDKIVAYFAHLEDLQRCADVLRHRVGGQAAHGVSFTAAITVDGLLSWAADPPARTSWRRWVTDRLAEHLVHARAVSAADAAQFALQRLRLEGIDTVAWVPTAHMWRETTGA